MGDDDSLLIFLGIQVTMISEFCMKVYELPETEEDLGAGTCSHPPFVKTITPVAGRGMLQFR